MLFGLNSATEVFQKKKEAAFAGIEGIHMVADDIIIAADTIEEHDAILQKLLTRAREQHIKFNFDKLQLRVDTVKYLGIIKYGVLNSRDRYEKLWLPEFSLLKTTLQQALAKKTNLDSLVLL